MKKGDRVFIHADVEINPGEPRTQEDMDSFDNDFPNRIGFLKTTKPSRNGNYVVCDASGLECWLMERDEFTLLD